MGIPNGTLVSPPLDPRDPNHPDHAMYGQIRGCVHRSDAAYGRTANEINNRVTAGLLVQVKREGLTEVDHVVFNHGGKDRDGDLVLANPYISAVQGEL